ncbi:MAG TPA: hypothetical protein DCO77_00690 [Nitrospiraceae bacterium]|nr:hypothetical protein [Nitrospiraceae bacterium]
MRSSAASAAILLSFTMTILSLSSVVHGKELKARAEKSDARELEISRHKRFLYRAIDEIGNSLSFIKEDIKGLDKQIDAIELFEPAQREDALRSFEDWFQNYADWLSGKSAEFEKDLERYYTEDSPGTEWADRYVEMQEIYEELGRQLFFILKSYSKKRGALEDAILRKRALLARIGEDEEEENKDRKGNNRKDRDRGKEEKEKKEKKKRSKKDEHDDAVRRAQLEQEIRSFGDILNHYEVLIEKGKGMGDWISLKANDCGPLNDVAHAIAGPRLSTMERSYEKIIGAYERDISAIRRKREAIDRKRDRIKTIGTLRTLDRMDELSAHYEQMKSRYEHHAAWLKVQIGAYRAELTEIWNLK